MDVALLLKMNSLVYIHPENQFYAPDTDYKIPVSLGTNVFVTVSHDVTHNLPYNLVSVSKLQNTSCSDEFIFDNCVRDVSMWLFPKICNIGSLKSFILKVS